MQEHKVKENPYKNCLESSASLFKQEQFFPQEFFHEISVSLSSQAALKLHIYFGSHFHAFEPSQITPTSPSCTEQSHYLILQELRRKKMTGYL